MLAVEFQGQLGNQLFQYAAARVQAERLGCGLIVVSNARLKQALHDACRNRLPHEIFEVFPHLTADLRSHGLALIRNISKPVHSRYFQYLFSGTFEPNFLTDEGRDQVGNVYDSRIWDIQRGTKLLGYFQSPQYFTGWEERVRRWYRTPHSKTADCVKSLIGKLPCSPEDMVAVHVRLGDYLEVRGPLGDDTHGWALSRDYYDRALAYLPRNMPIALFSDDPKRACSLLPREPEFISSGMTAAVDLFSIGKFRNIVIANSSFSWWAAWLRSPADTTVIAPEFHIGRHKRVWFPADIKVDGWVYV